MHRGALPWLPRPRRDTEAQRCPRQASWPGALARGLQIPVRRRENAAAVLRVAAAGPAGRGRGEQGQDAVRTWLDSVQGGLSPPGGDPGGPGAA